jgi:release factor glutamine methyltransferase
MAKKKKPKPKPKPKAKPRPKPKPPPTVSKNKAAKARVSVPPAAASARHATNGAANLGTASPAPAMAAVAQPSVSLPRIVPPVASPFAPQPDTLQGWLAEAERRLAEAGIESARLDAQILIAAVLGGDPGALRFAEDHPVESRDGQRIENFLRRRAKTREPVSRILGKREFWSLDFRITPAVLDPRPDSETLIEAALACFPNRAAPLAVLDLGTGSGCLLLAALSEFPNAAGLGVDASEKALAVAAENAERLGLAERVEFRKSDWGGAVSEAFDLVLCNPPYIAEAERAALAPEVARHDPPAALFAGPDGLDAYRAILPDLPRLLAPEGRAVFEIGATQAAAVSDIARAAGLDVIATKRDLGGHERCVVLTSSPALAGEARWG